MEGVTPAKSRGSACSAQSAVTPPAKAASAAPSCRAPSAAASGQRPGPPSLSGSQVSQLRRGTSQGDLGALLTAGGGQKRAERLTVEDYMRILTFESALTPKTYSNLHDRFARKLRDELESRKERTHEYFLIKEHLEKMDKVLAFAATDISTRPSADLQDDLKVIHAIVGTWPTNIKDAIMARRISDLGEIND
eukprot:2324582-Pyramimonas_sp.AAC.1